MTNNMFWVTLVSSSTGAIHKAMDTKTIRENSYARSGRAYMRLDGKEYLFARIED